MMPRFYIETFGCQMNELDSEKISGLLMDAGYMPELDLEEADIFLINTCSVREKAVQKVLSRLGEIRRWKEAGTDRVVAVLGCLAQQEGKELLKKAAMVDIVTGTHQLSRFPEQLNQFFSEKIRLIRTDFLSDQEPAEYSHIHRQNPFQAQISIQEGCNKFCSFCIVPYTRGREKNRSSGLILDEVRKLADEGYVEIILLGQNVNSYRDPSPENRTFSQLLTSVASIPGIRRVRFTSPHPADFDQDLLEAIADIPVLCNQIHLPMQSGSTEILTKMRRGYTAEDYRCLVDRIRNLPRNIEISTDIIVGFPGETDQDFQRTLSLLEYTRFNSVFSFLYSPRPFTRALEYPDSIPMEEKKKRLICLQQVQKNIQLDKNKGMLGKTVEVLVDGSGRYEGQFCGRTTENISVNFLATKEDIGKFLKINIKEIFANSMIGDIYR